MNRMELLRRGPSFRFPFPYAQLKSKRKPGQSKFARIGICLSVATLTLGLAPSMTLPHARGTFPGRNGSIVFPVRQCPCQEGPTEPFLALDYDLFVVAPGGTGVQRMTGTEFDTEFDIQPSWSPDGRRIVFARGQPTSTQADIYVTDVDGGELINLTNSPGAVDYGPAFSPDGAKIAFNSDQASPEPVPRVTRTQPDGDLYVMDADGSNVVQLTSGAGGQNAPSWSPDGKWIAFQDTATRRIGLVHPDGSGLRLLPNFPLGSVAPQWSPDGKKIVFFSTQGTEDVWVMNADGTSPKNLTPRSYRFADRAPVWSPDGRSIAFISNRDGGYKLYRMRPDGSQVTQLVDLELQSDTTPDWGPRP